MDEAGRRMIAGAGIQIGSGGLLLGGALSLTAGLLDGRWLPILDSELPPAMSGTLAFRVTGLGMVGLRVGWGVRQGQRQGLGLFTLLTLGLLGFAIYLLIVYEALITPVFFGLMLLACLYARQCLRRAEPDLPG